MRVGAPHDWPTFWDDYDNGVWEPETKAVLERFLHPGDLFLDVGAWCGPVTLWAVELGATVVAIEPDPVAFAALTANTKGLGAVIRIQAAVSDDARVAYLANPHMGDSQSRLAETGIAVDTMWLTAEDDGLVQFADPALIKLDIEGHELHVLPDLLALHVPTYISWHEPWWDLPISDDERASWFTNFTLEPVRGDGWTGFSELLAIPR